VAEELASVEKQLRKDAKGAEELFPKAAQSARDLADRIEELRLESLARQATGQMLAGAGDTSFQLADRLRAEMEKLFGECKSQGQPQMSNELDQYLRLTRNCQPGNTFSQMMQSRKFGGGKGRGFALGKGMTGMGGEGGYAMSAAPTLDVHGNETFISQRANTANQSGKAGLGQGDPNAENAVVSLDKPDVVKGVNPVNRQSDAVASESMVGEYSDLVDKYFKVITK
ncbi:MAG: hypothetical protein AB1705_27590, partial [Verrucomicrobiota bacterium]